MDFLIIIGLIVLFWFIKNRLNGLETRIKSLEKEMTESRAGKAPVPVDNRALDMSSGSGAQNLVPAADRINVPDSPAADGILPPAAPESAAGQSSGFGVWEWLREDWMMKLGAVLIFLGFAWLLTYAFMNNWIGPAGRIAFGFVAGALIMALGDWRANKYLRQGTVLIALGGGVVLLTMFAARTVYDFFSPASALLILALVPAYIALASYRFGYQVLAVLGLAAGALVPLLVDSPTINVTGLFSYLLILNVFYLLLVWFKGWRALALFSFFIFFIYSAGSLSVQGDDRTVMLMFTGIFTFLYYLAVLALIHRNKKAGHSDLLLAGAAGLYYLLWIENAVAQEYQGLWSAAAALFFVCGSFLSFNLNRLKEPMLIYAGLAVFYFGAATAFELSGPALVIAFTLEVLVLSLLAYRLSDSVSAGLASAFLLSVPALLSLESFNISRWRDGFINQDFFVLLLLSAAFLFLGIYYYRRSRFGTNTNQTSGLVQGSAILIMAGSLYGLILIRLVMQSVADNDRDLANIITLIIYTVIGLFFYLYGNFRAFKAFKLPSELLLGYVGARLLLIEVWRMDLSGRIVVFFAVGALLIASAFFKSRKKQ